MFCHWNKCKVSATDQPHTLLGSIFNFTFTFQNSSLNSLLLQITSELHFWTFQAQNTENTDWSRYEHWVVSCKLKTLMMKSQLETGVRLEERNKQHRGTEIRVRQWERLVWMSEVNCWSGAVPVVGGVSASSPPTHCDQPHSDHWLLLLTHTRPAPGTIHTNPGLYYMSLILSNFKIHPWFNKIQTVKDQWFSRSLKYKLENNAVVEWWVRMRQSLQYSIKWQWEWLGEGRIDSNTRT